MLTTPPPLGAAPTTCCGRRGSRPRRPDGRRRPNVGKAEEFGQARVRLQVRSDAERPSEIRNSWSVWSTVEKVWKEAPDVKCIAVSATAGVVIQGPTPNNLLQDKLGEAARPWCA